MKIRFIRCTALVALGLAAMGNSSCPTTGSTGISTSMNAAESALAMDALTAINAHRATRGLGPLAWYAAGAQVAFQHDLAMESGNFFAHVNPTTGTDPATRAKNAGITHDPSGFLDPTSGNPFVGENLYTTTDPAATGQICVDAWIGSPGHYTQIVAPLSVTGAQTMPAWTHCGIGVRKSGNTSWWTAMFFRNPN